MTSKLLPSSPSLTIQLDAVGGVAGDMFIAAVLHAFPHLQAGMLSAIALAGVPEQLAVLVEARADNALTGLGFRVVEGEDHDHAGAHSHHRFSDICANLRASSLPSGVIARALAIFTLLAGAEAEVHGKALETVS
ncbi:MAG: nickel insertion protein, partial [Parahaliea sp.]